MFGMLKVIYVYLDLRECFINLIWNDQQSFYVYLYHFHIIIPPPSTNFVNEDLTWLFKWTVIKVFNIHKTFF